MSHSHKLQKLCALRGLDQATLAQKLGVSRSSMSRLLSGAQEPKLGLALKLAHMLEVSLDYLADEAVPIDANPCMPMLSDDELTLLKLVRRMGVEEAFSRLLGVESQIAGEVVEHVH